MATLDFSGYLPSGGPSSQFHADIGPDSSNLPLVSSQGYIPPSCTVTDLRIDPTLNTTAAATTFTIYKNGSPTAVTVTVGASSVTPASDVAHSVTFNGTTDTMDLVSARSGSLTTALAFGATVKTTPL